jgi:hypothetical protein
VRGGELPRHDRQNAEANHGMSALRTLLAGVVDYAGLFPPASLDMTTAARNYREYRADPDAWMLGRFVVPAGRLAELNAAPSANADDASPMRLTVVLGPNVRSDIAAVRSFNVAHGTRFSVASLEARLRTEEAIASAFEDAAPEFVLFAELPLDLDPAPLVAAVARAGGSAKMRTGGVSIDTFPSAREIVRFMHCCLDAKVAFKATAGLHHPIRAEYSLTYDASAPRGTMFGYLNLFLASGFLHQGMAEADAMSILEERDPAAFIVARDSVTWRGHSLSTAELRELREHRALSFGSCSFREPVDELRALEQVD